MPKRTSGRITDFDEKTITEILESPDLGRKLSKILDGNVRLALTAQKLLYRKMIDSGGSLNATQLNNDRGNCQRQCDSHAQTGRGAPGAQGREAGACPYRAHAESPAGD